MTNLERTAYRRHLAKLISRLHQRGLRRPELTGIDVEELPVTHIVITGVRR